jgi:hypothetical protein
MVRSRLLALLLVPLAFMLMGGANPVPLTDPQPLAVPAGLTIEQVTKAIKVGVLSRTGWAITKEEPGQFEATLNVRQHMLKVNIPYNTSTVSIKYVDSQNLDYGDRKGVKVIHPKWNNWTRNLLSDIQRELQLLTVK